MFPEDERWHDAQNYHKCPYCNGRGYWDEGPSRGLCPYCDTGIYYKRPLRLRHLRTDVPVKEWPRYKEVQARRKKAKEQANDDV